MSSTSVPIPSQAQPVEPPQQVPSVTVDLILDALQRSARGVARGAESPQQPPPRPSPIGQTIAGYRLVRLLGRGGMAEVYEAVQVRLRRPVALKLLGMNDDGRDLTSRFLREARAMMQVRHENLTTIYDVGKVDGIHYLAMELVTGGDLASRIDRTGPLPVDEALQLMIGCCNGLAAMHAAGLVHRDIKPANIFLASDGGPKVGDFGLARQVSGGDRMTVTGSAWGTPSYMAPEQIVGAADVDGRADLYALGATFYTTLTGRDPFSGETAYLATFKAMTEPFPDPRLFNAAIPTAVAAIIRMATEHERTRRYSSARSMREDLERAARQELLIHTGNMSSSARSITHPLIPPTAKRPLQVTPAPASRRRRWQLLLVAGLALIASGWWWSGSVPPPEPDFPGWATSGGRDGAGRWVEITVGAATTRLHYRPSGTFRMGSPTSEPGHSSDESPHEVVVDHGFWIQDTECDQGFYQAVVGENPSRHRGEQLPVEQVSWEDARAFCAALMGRGVPARLPMEIEWEYACRAGSEGAFAGTDVAAMSWTAPEVLRPLWRQGEDAVRRWCDDHQDDLRLRTHPVGHRVPNAAGLFDLHGNVQEWCAERWDNGPVASPGVVTDPFSVQGKVAIVRGGSWFHPEVMARSAARMVLATDRRSDHVGFRFIVPDQTSNPMVR